MGNALTSAGVVSLAMAANNPGTPSAPFIDPTIIATSGPYAGYPVLPEGMEWTQFPWDPKFVEDPEWYDTLGLDMLQRRQVFETTDKDELHRKLEELLTEFPRKGMDILFKACVKKRPDVVRWCLNKGVRAHPNPGVDSDNEEGDNMACVPIHAAAANGCLECVKILVEEAGVGVNSKDELGGTPVMRAATGKHTDILRWLVEKGADLRHRETTDDGKLNALDHAVLTGDVNTVRLIFEVLEKEVKQEEKEPPSLVTNMVMRAVGDCGDIDTLNFILEKGGFPTNAETDTWKGSRLTEDQRTAIKTALRQAYQPKPEFLKILLSYLSQPDNNGNLPYIRLEPDLIGPLFGTAVSALKRGDISTFELLWHTVLDDPNDPDWETVPTSFESKQPKQEALNYLLIEAVGSGQLDAVKLMLKYGADVHKAHGRSFTPPLYVAVIDNRVQVVRYLLEEYGSEQLDIAGGRYANGPTALACAVMANDPRWKETVKILLMYGGPIEVIEWKVEVDRARKLVVSVANVYRQETTVVISDDTYEVEKQAGIHYVSLELKDEDIGWLQRIQKRKSDEELAREDPWERELKMRDPAAERAKL